MEGAHAASHFGAREIDWMHASYGFGAAIGGGAEAPSSLNDKFGGEIKGPRPLRTLSSSQLHERPT